MSLSVSLSNALSGLNVNQQALTVLSQNIANANTPGYSKQSINQQAVYIDGQGQGVTISDVTRKVDEYLLRSVQTQYSEVGKASIVNDYNTRIQLMIGQPGSQNSIDSYINNMFNAVQSLSQTPQNTSLQQAVVNNGVTLANQMRSLASGLQNLQFQADQDVTTAIAAINSDLRNLATLNATISTNLALGKSVADLQDKRDNLLNDLSQYLNITTYTRESGALNITAGNGVSLLDDNVYQLTYDTVSSADAFNNGTILGPIRVTRINEDGTAVGTPVELVPGGAPSEIVSPVTGGKLAGLLAMRDSQVPNIMAQLDQISSQIRDQINLIQNSGSGYPGANSYTGSRLLTASDFNSWTGSVRIAVLNANGQPITSPYIDESNGVAPLTLDLSALSDGSPTVQNIIDAINQYYGAQQPKVEVGNLNNIQLISDIESLPATPPTLTFDFNLSNIAATGSNFYVTGVVVKDNLGTTLSNGTLDIPSVNLASTNTYFTTSGSTNVIVNTDGAHGFAEGDIIYLAPPTSPSSVNGIDAADLGGFFTVSNVTSTSFEITANGTASSGGAVNSSGVVAYPPYAQVPAGGMLRTLDNGTISADLSGNTTAPYYNVVATIVVDDGSGDLKTSQVTYRVNNQQNAMMGMAFAAQSATGEGTIITPTSARAIATATLVDANGRELPKINGKYVTTQSGYLKIKAAEATYTIAIDSLDSVESGRPNSNPPVAGSGLGFSSYFNMNNFFKSNSLTNTGDSVAGSALNLQVNTSLISNPGLLALGQLTRSAQSSVPGSTVNYTYELNPGDNSVISRLSALANGTVNFRPAGGLGATAQTLSGYAGQIIGTTATNAATAKANNSSSQSVLDTYTKQASSISGVNLDTELANTVIYQNAYTASARIITVVNALFDALLQTFG